MKSQLQPTGSLSEWANPRFKNLKLDRRDIVLIGNNVYLLLLSFVQDVVSTAICLPIVCTG